jgi:hypothetical protein
MKINISVVSNKLIISKAVPLSNFEMLVVLIPSTIYSIEAKYYSATLSCCICVDVSWMHSACRVLFNLTIDNASPFTLLKIAVPEILGTATLPRA